MAVVTASRVRTGRLVGSVPGPLWVLIALSLLLALAWAVVTPPLTNADESGHFAYVQHLAETGRAPQQDSGHQTLSTEEGVTLAALGLQPTIGNAAARPTFSAVDRAAFDAFEGKVTHAQRADGDGPNQFVQNGPLYYVAGAIAYRLTPGGKVLDRLFVVRMLGGLMMVGVVILTWLLAAELFTAAWPRTLAASVVLLQPKLGNAGGMVNPDILLTLIWTAFAWLSVRTVRQGLALRRTLVLAALTGASVLTHGRGLALILPLVVALALAWRRPWGEWRALVRPAAIALGIVAVCGIVGVAWTSAHSGQGAYGGELGQAAGGANSSGSLKGVIAYIFNFYFGGFQALGPVPGAFFGWRQGYIETFFGSLGSLDVVFQPHIYDYLQLLAAAGLLALWTQVVWFRDRLPARWRELAMLAVICLAQIGLLHLASYRDLVQSNGAAILWSGRYLLPLIAVFGVAVAFVCSHLPRRIAALSAGGVVGVGIVLQLGSLGLALDRFYG